MPRAEILLVTSNQDQLSQCKPSDVCYPNVQCDPNTNCNPNNCFPAMKECQPECAPCPPNNECNPDKQCKPDDKNEVCYPKCKP